MSETLLKASVAASILVPAAVQWFGQRPTMTECRQLVIKHGAASNQ